MDQRRRQLGPGQRELIRDAVVILLAVLILAWLSSLADPEPALPKCRPMTTERCQP